MSFLCKILMFFLFLILYFDLSEAWSQNFTADYVKVQHKVQILMALYLQGACKNEIRFINTLALSLYHLSLVWCIFQTFRYKRRLDIREGCTYSQVPIKNACTLNYFKDHFGHFLTHLKPLIERTVQGRANKLTTFNQGFQGGQKMAKMVPKIVKRAGTLNRQLRVP